MPGPLARFAVVLAHLDASGDDDVSAATIP